MKLTKTLKEASDLANAHLPTHASSAASQIPQNDELKKSFTRADDTAATPLAKKHLPVTDSAEEVASADDAKLKAFDPAFDGAKIADDMHDGFVTEEDEVEEEDEEKKLEEEADAEKVEEEDEEKLDEEEEEEAKKAVEEHVSVLLSGESLSESFKSKAKTIFEAAVKDQVDAKSKKLQEKYQIRLEKQKSAYQKQLAEQVEGFLDYVVEEWLNENEIAIETGIQVEISESFFDGLKTLFTNHNIEVPANKTNLVNELSAEKEKAEAELNETYREVLKLRKQIETLNRDKMISEACQGLSNTEKDKLKKLAEGLQYESEGSFKNKVETLKESYFAPKTQTGRDLAEAQIEYPANKIDEKKGAVDPRMDAYVQTATKIAARSKK